MSMHHVAGFAQALLAAEASVGLDDPRLVEDTLLLAYEEVAYIRDMSEDESWKVPCNAFRTAFQHRDVSTPSGVIAVGWQCLRDLPDCANLTPLNYEKPQPTVVV